VTVFYGGGEVALAVGVDPATLQSWEAGQHQPIGRNVEPIERFLSISKNSLAISNGVSQS